MGKQTITIPEKPKLRYVCHGCTNNAILTTNKMLGVTIACQHCGLEQVTEEDKYIVL